MKNELINIRDYSFNEQRELLESNFEEVEVVCLNVTSEQDKEEIKDIRESIGMFRKQELKQARFSLIESHLEEYKKNGWNVDYAEDTISSCIANEGVDIYCVLVKGERKEK